MTLYLGFTAGPKGSDRLWAGVQGGESFFVAGPMSGRGVVIVEITNDILVALQEQDALFCLVTFTNLQWVSLPPLVTSRFAGCVIYQYKVSDRTAQQHHRSPQESAAAPACSTRETTSRNALTRRGSG